MKETDKRGMMYVEQGAVNAIVWNRRAESITPDFTAQLLLLRSEVCRMALEEMAPEEVRLPEGSIYEHFRPHSFDRIRNEQQHLIDAVDAGGILATIHAIGSRLPDFTDVEDVDEGELLAFARLSAFGPDDQYARIEEVTVHTMLQEQGLGSAAVHAALQFNDFDPDGRVSATALAHNPASMHFFGTTLGLERRDELPVPPLVLSRDDVPSGLTIPKYYYETPPRDGLQDVLYRLEDWKPWLLAAVPL